MGYKEGMVVGPQIQVFECIDNFSAFIDLLTEHNLLSMFNEDDGCTYVFDPATSINPYEIALVLPTDYEKQLEVFKLKHETLIAKITRLLAAQPDEISCVYAAGGRMPAEETINVVWATTIYNTLG
jgi:hypothetical protein